MFQIHIPTFVSSDSPVIAVGLVRSIAVCLTVCAIFRLYTIGFL